MKIEQFIILFADQFDETDISLFKTDTKFRDLEEWSSLVAMAVLNMIDKKCKSQVKSEEMRNCQTIQELYDLAITKRQ
jgi:acyl carrier protein